MDSKNKKLSNPTSTGGKGVHFEAYVQASFVTLMLTGGYAPCLPRWPITKIKLQGKIDGFDTDDLIITVEDLSSKEQRKLLGQIKHSIDITDGNSIFGEVMQAAWNDFNNAAIFKKDKDIIALITGPLTKNDIEVSWILDHARVNSDNCETFFRDISTAIFCSNVRRKKLEVIRNHLKNSNNGVDISNEIFHKFLTRFYLLGYDLGEESGVVLSLIESHILQFNPEPFVWSRIVNFINNRNYHAGCITRSNLPDDLKDIFIAKPVSEFPKNLAPLHTCTTNWTQHPDATYLALAILIGAWDNSSQHDLDAITQLLGINHDQWLNKAREILHDSDSPLSTKNGIWKIVNRAQLWSQLGSRILDQDLKKFYSLAVSVLKEPDPVFELSVEKRYAPSIYGKTPKYSYALRQGIAEGLAILGSQPNICNHCSYGKAESIGISVLHELLPNADWILWGSLNNLLPILAEAAPNQFLDAVEKTMRIKPCPFDELFSQQSNNSTNGNYLTGLLWALEGLAWDEQYLVRVCVILSELANRDPSNHWSNSPSNSLITILLPWLPQTLASVNKRKIAVQAVLSEYPNIAWKLIIQLLPDQHQTSYGSYKPNWRKIIPDNWKQDVTHQEYLEQVSFYAALAVTTADLDIDRLLILIDRLDSLPNPAFGRLLETLVSNTILELPEERRFLIWMHLKKFTNKHRENSGTELALPNEAITHIEQTIAKITPKTPFILHQYIFTSDDYTLYEEVGNYIEQREKLDTQREIAILEIFQQMGIKGVIEFSESVSAPDQVGQALSAIDDPSIEQAILPVFLDAVNNKHKALVINFIKKRYQRNDWKWCDKLDRASWTPTQIGLFLTYLPFTKETWTRASTWLGQNESIYWTNISPNAYEADSDLEIAIEKLIECGRPCTAINCLSRLLRTNQLTNTSQCVQALFAARSSSESSCIIDNIARLIQFLQEESAVEQNDLFKVEWIYLPLLNHLGIAPKHLEKKLANEPEFFCEAIQLVYQSKKEDQPSIEFSEDSEAIAKNFWQLLHKWKTPPGIQEDGSFSEKYFTEWLQKVKETCMESGHLEAALSKIGEVLIYTPPDSSGLWINSTVAAALNDRDVDDMRNGFSAGRYSSRGVCVIDPTGEPEKKLAKQTRYEAEAIENAGFQRFATVLRSLADSYDRMATRIASGCM